MRIILALLTMTLTTTAFALENCATLNQVVETKTEDGKKVTMDFHHRSGKKGENNSSVDYSVNTFKLKTDEVEVKITYGEDSSSTGFRTEAAISDEQIGTPKRHRVEAIFVGLPTALAYKMDDGIEHMRRRKTRQQQTMGEELSPFQWNSPYASLTEHGCYFGYEGYCKKAIERMEDILEEIEGSEEYLACAEELLENFRSKF